MKNKKNKTDHTNLKCSFRDFLSDLEIKIGLLANPLDKDASDFDEKIEEIKNENKLEEIIFDNFKYMEKIEENNIISDQKLYVNGYKSKTSFHKISVTFTGTPQLISCKNDTTTRDSSDSEIFTVEPGNSIIVYVDGSIDGEDQAIENAKQQLSEESETVQLAKSNFKIYQQRYEALWAKILSPR